MHQKSRQWICFLSNAGLGLRAGVWDGARQQFGGFGAQGGAVLQMIEFKLLLSEIKFI